jgi:hypothetical protein
MLGKAIIFLAGFAFIIFILIAVASVMATDRPTDNSIYTNSTTINKTSALADKLVKSTPGMALPGILIGSIFVFGAGIMLFTKQSKL